ncbi:MAG: NADH-quinone oxidoreductase subunit NuoE [Firmicutes bacterium]|jgi:NADH-quinone oxidoreductase subunit E|nr:NADH-quinone oxidoreductase subunit NuoE [Bacillota bacterium]
MWVERLDEGLQEIFSRFEGKQDNLIPLLQATQDYYGYLPMEAMQAIGRYVSVSESKVYGVATFYAQFHFSRRGKHEIKVCYGTACHVRGGGGVLDAFERELKISCGETTPDYEYSLERVACVGSCALAPVVVVDETVYGQMEAGKVKKIFSDGEKKKEN